MRALSLEQDPDLASRPFDIKRNGFVGTGGAVTIVLETKEEAEKRGVTPYAKFSGWGQGSDGHNVAISHPQGRGLQDSMRRALKDARLQPTDIDYLNAHAPSTPIGDASEMKAVKEVFPLPQRLQLSSTWRNSSDWSWFISLQHHGGCILLPGNQRWVCSWFCQCKQSRSGVGTFKPFKKNAISTTIDCDEQ